MTSVADVQKALGEKMRDKRRLSGTAPIRGWGEYITPAYPPEAYALAASWESSHRKPAIALSFQNQYPGQCKNCGGLGGVYMRLTNAGPYSTPLGLGQISTYFEGNERFGRGWYAVDKTYSYPCPDCGGGQ